MIRRACPICGAFIARVSAKCKKCLTEFDVSEMDLVGRVELAQRAGTSPSVIDVWRRRHASFPAPIVDLAMGPVWDWPSVEAWLAIPRPNGRPSKASLAVDHFGEVYRRAIATVGDPEAE